jgi:hypothetical protein
VMMEDFHDSARRAGKALDMVALVEARPIGLGDSTRTDRRGASHRARRLHRQRSEGGCPVGLRCSLSDTAPELAVRGRDRHPRNPSCTRPTTRGLHRGRRQRRGGRSTRACHD